VLMFFLSELSLLGYLVSPRFGAYLYNVFHFQVTVIFLFFLLNILTYAFLFQPFLIWLAHIHFNRMLGVGFKDVKGAAYTHLGYLGSKKWFQFLSSRE
jgi:hypothetical protein